MGKLELNCHPMQNPHKKIIFLIFKRIKLQLYFLFLLVIRLQKFYIDE